jgi:hypothetical protein
MGPYGTLGATQRYSYVSYRHILVVSENKRRTLVHADSFQGITNTLVDKFTIQLPDSRILIRRHSRMNSTIFNVVPVFDQSTVVVYCRIGCDGIQPAGKRPVAMEPTDLTEHFQPYFLDAILHLRRIEHDPVADSMDPVGVAVVQPGRGISVAALDCLDQAFV